MGRTLLLFVSVLGLASCQLEQRTVPPEERPIGCEVDADCAASRWCDRGLCQPPPAEPVPPAPVGEGEGEGEGESEAGPVPG